MKPKRLRPLRLKPRGNFISRLWNTIFSDTTFNKIVKFNSTVGHYLHFYPIKKPEIVEDEYGFRVQLTPHYTRTHVVINLLALYGLYFYCAFEILQMIRFFPKDGFSRRTISVVFYFDMTLLSSIMTTTFWMNSKLLVQGWNWIEHSTRYFMRNGCKDAWKWKKSFGTLSFVGTVVCIAYFAGVILAIFFMIKPNNTAHIFYLLPEKWKPYTISYIVMCLWQTFLITATVLYLNHMAVMAIGFVYFSKYCINSVVRNDFRKDDGVKAGMRIQMMRNLTLLNKMANEAVASFFAPVFVFFVIVTGVLFSYIAITRFDDPNIDKVLYSLIVVVDVLMLVIVTVVFTEAGKYEDASLEMIVSTRAALDDPYVIASGKAPLFLKYIRYFKTFGINVSFFARLNDETTQLTHETIIDYLLLLLTS